MRVARAATEVAAREAAAGEEARVEGWGVLMEEACKVEVKEAITVVGPAVGWAEAREERAAEEAVRGVARVVRRVAREASPAVAGEVAVHSEARTPHSA